MTKDYLKDSDLTAGEMDSLVNHIGTDPDWKLCENELPKGNYVCAVVCRKPGESSGLIKTAAVFEPPLPWQEARFMGVLKSDYNTKVRGVYAWKRLYL